MYRKLQKVDFMEVLNNPNYTEYEKRKARKYEKILFDAETEEMQAGRCENEQVRKYK